MGLQLINLLWLFLIGVLFAAFEIIVDKYESTIFPQSGKMSAFFNPSISWKNKYAFPLTTTPSGIYGAYHKHFNLKYKERFLFSGTLLVFFTDFRHILKMALVLSIIGLALFYTPLMGVWVDWLIGAFIILAVFELFYSKIFIR